MIRLEQFGYLRALLVLAATAALFYGGFIATFGEVQAQDNSPAEEGAESNLEPEVKGGIAVPPEVRSNLGIRFAKVEKRAVAKTRRIPGAFELLPEARFEYRALLGGRVTLYVEQFQDIDAGCLLLTINSPKWRQTQHEAVEAEGEITMAEARRDVAKARLEEGRTLLGKVNERVGNLADSGVRNAALEAESTALRSSLPRLEAELREREAAVDEAHEHYHSRLRTLSSVTGISVAELTGETGQISPWRAITELEVRATGSGRVEAIQVNQGAWMEEGELAITTVDSEKIRFHADAPQSDLAYYRDGQQARIVPSQGGSVGIQDVGHGTLVVGLTAHPVERTISMFVRPEAPVPWARAGVSAYLEVNTSETGGLQLAIPQSSVIQDGLEHVFFRRDPNDPDRVLRAVADLGESDGRWVALRSGVWEGDEIVLEGAYALKLTGSGQQAPEGYHYHADGSLHKDH
jgi:hypothetical protein